MKENDSIEQLKDFFNYFFKKNKDKPEIFFLIRRIMKKIIYCEKRIFDLEKQKDKFKNLNMLHVEIIYQGKQNIELFQEWINIEKLRISTYEDMLLEIENIYHRYLHDFGYDPEKIKIECKNEIDKTIAFFNKGQES